VLHVGRGKTGTTTLQHALNTARDALPAASGVLYPLIDGTYNHTSLVPAAAPNTRIARSVVFDRLGDATPQGAVSASNALWREVLDAVRTAACPTVVLSSERFFLAWDPDDLRAFAERLSAAFGDIVVAMYLRSPPAYYLSTVQQRVKHQSEFAAPSTSTGILGIIEAYEWLSGGTVAPRIFDRGELLGGDIVTDFAESFLPTPSSDVLRAHADRSRNATVSPEAMALLQEAHWQIEQGPDRQSAKARQRLRLRVIECDRGLDGFRRPKLRPQVEEAITRVDEGPVRLREARGLVYPGLDYSIAGKARTRDRELLLGLRNVSDVVDVDSDRLAALRSATEEAARRKARERTPWRARLAAGVARLRRG
jgi:hypothetical protein